MKVYDEISGAKRQIKKVFNELKENKVVKSYWEENIMDISRKNKIANIRYHLTSHSDFISDIISTNSKEKVIAGMIG